MQKDGSVYISVGLNTNNVKTALNDLSNSIKNVFRAFSGQSVSTPQLDALNAQAEKSAQKIDELRQKIKDMSSTKVQSTAAAKLDEEFAKAESEVQRLEDKYSDFVKLYESTGGKTALPDELQKAYDKVAQLENEMNNLVKSGKDTTTEAAKHPKEFAKANEELLKEEEKLTGIRAKMAQVANAGQTSSGKVKNSFKSMTSHVVNAFRKIRDHAKSSSKSASDSFNDINGAIKKGIKTIVKYGLGMRSLFFLFRKLRSAVVDSFKDLAGYSDKVNKSVSDAKSALSTLKNSVAAAIQPLVTAITPLITSLANKLTELVYSVGQFFAALTGQNYAIKALSVQEDYADSLDDTAKNANKATKALQKYLSPLDDINRYSEEDSTTTTTASANKTAKFTETKVGEAFKGLANKVKGYFTDIFKPIKNAWDQYGAGVMQSWDRLLRNIKGLIGDVALAFKNVWTNGSGERIVGNILLLWQSILDTINTIIDTFRKAWNKDLLGEQVVQSFIDRFNNMISFIRTVIDTFREVWEDGTGERIWTNILRIVRNINRIIGGFWERLKKAWDKNETGKKIWQDILGIVEDVSEWFSDITEITAEWVEDLDLNPILSAFETLFSTIRDLAKVIGSKLKDAYKNVLLPLAKWTIEKGLPALINLFAGALKILTNIIKKIPLSVLTGIGAAVATIFAVFKGYQLIVSALTAIASGIGKMAAMLMAHPYVAMFAAIAAAIIGVVTAIKTYNDTKWNNSSLKAQVDAAQDYAEKIGEAADAITQSVEDANKNFIEVKADISQVEDLKERLMKVIKDGVIDEDEMPEYKTVIDLLNRIDGFEEVWDGIELKQINGKIYVNTEEAESKLDAFLEKYKKTMWTTTAQDVYSNLKTTQAQNTVDLSTAKTQQDKLVKIIGKKFKDSYAGKLLIKELENAGVKNITDELLGKEVIKMYNDPSSAGYPAWLEKLGMGVNEWLSSSGLKESVDTYNKLGDEAERYQVATDASTESSRHLNDLLLFLNGDMTKFGSTVWAVRNNFMSEDDALQLVNESLKANGQQGFETYSDLEKNVTSYVEGVHNGMEDVDKSAKTAYGNINKYSKDSKEKANTDAKGAQDAFTTAFDVVATTGKNAFSGLFNHKTAAETDAANIKSAYLPIFKWFASSPLATHLKSVWGWDFSNVAIPHLAEGSVLPAGKPFLAMLGDQKNGTNLETPEWLMRKVVREESGGTSTPVTVNVDGRQLISFIIDGVKKQTSEIGYNPLVKIGG